MICEFDGCEKQQKARGHCSGHYAQILRGYPLTKLKVRGNGYKDAHGYWVLFKPDHPNTQANGLIREHVYVMSKMIGRPLMKHENVHHKNGVRDDNRPENLELWSSSQPAGQRITDKLAWAHEMIALYEPLEQEGVL